LAILGTEVSSSVQRTRRREQRETTRREILAAADRMLRQRPYRELSVDAVMAQTGLTRTAFYRHFDDVPSLVLQLLQDTGRELYEMAERWRADAETDLADSVRQGLDGIVAFMAAHGRLIRAVADAAATDEEIEQGYRQFRQVFETMIADGLTALAGSGRVHLPHPSVMAKALNLMNEAFLLDQFGQMPLGDPQVVLDTLQTAWLRVLEA
jgi:AcrR family transcriptional regulator